MIISALFWLLTAAVVAIFVARAWGNPRPGGVRSGTLPGTAAPAAEPSSEGRAERPAEGAQTQLRVRRRARPPDRERMVRSGVDAVVLLVMVRALFPPPGSGSWLWVAAAVAVGVGVAGVIIGWPRLPASRRGWSTVVYAVVGAGLVAVLA